MNSVYIIIGILVFICMVLCALLCLKVKYAFSIVAFIAGVLFLIMGLYLFSATAWRKIAVTLLGISFLFLAVTFFLLKKADRPNIEV